MASDDLMTIGDLAARTGLATSALRYYEELGLLPAPDRVGGQRRYRSSAVEHVGIILFLRDVGFSLGEIKTLLESRARSVRAWRDLARDKIAELDERIEKARVARVALDHALRCRHEDLLSCPTFWDVVARRLAGQTLEEAHPSGH